MSEHDNSWYENGEIPAQDGGTSAEEFQNRGCWTDARYIPVGQDAVPPKYYTPQPKAAKPQKAEGEKSRGGCGAWKVFGIVMLCIFCVALGAAGGAALAEYRFADRVSRLEQRLTTAENGMVTVSQSVEAVNGDVQALGEDLTEVREAVSEQAATAQASAAGVAQEGIGAGEVYTQACSQVVGITTEVTYTNFFGQTSSSAVTGTGFIVREDGYIVTNYHVIEYAYRYNYKITVIDHTGERYEAAIIGVEEDNDLAVLKIDATGLVPVVFADNSALTVGDTVYAVGNPLGELEFTMTTGHVSALGRLITTEDSAVPINMFQIDAAVNSGNSGGPVYDVYGSVIGVVTAKYSETGVEGIGFAIPANDAASIVTELISKGYVSGKACLGVLPDSYYTTVYSRYYGTPEGVYVSTVVQGSAAATAGIERGDVITALGDTAITSVTELAAALRQYGAGESCKITVYRSGQTIQLAVTFGEVTPDTSRGGIY